MSYYLDLLWRELDPQDGRLPQRRVSDEKHSNPDKRGNDLSDGSILGSHCRTLSTSKPLPCTLSRTHRYKRTLAECEGEGSYHVRGPSFCCSTSSLYQPPAAKRRRSDMKAAVSQFREQVSRQDVVIKELQDKVQILEEAVAHSEEQHAATKKRMLRVRKQLKVVQETSSPKAHNGYVEGACHDGAPLPSSNCNKCTSVGWISPQSDAGRQINTTVDLHSKSPGLLPDSQSFCPDVDCHIEVVDCSNIALTPQRQSPVSRCPEMLTPVSQTLCSTLQMLENLASSSNHHGSTSHKNKRPSGRGVDSTIPMQTSGGRSPINTVHQVPMKKAPKAKPLNPLKAGTKVLSSSAIDRSSLFTVKQVLSMFEGNNIAVVASKLAEMAVYGLCVLKKCTPRGQSKYTALPQDELYFLKQTLLDHTPAVWDDPNLFEEIWSKQCMSRIAGSCNQARR